MARSYYSMVREKLGIIYIVLSHIYLVQTINIITQRLIIDEFILIKYLLYNSVFILKLGTKYIIGYAWRL